MILVVDDEPMIRRVLELQLKHFGYRVALAAGGPEGLALFRALGEQVALVLLDVHMPGMSGPTTLAALRQIDPGVPCWFMSGFPAGILQGPSPNGGGEGSAHPVDVGASEVLDKPFRMERLEALLRATLGPP